MVSSMKSDINAALRALADDAGLAYTHTATNVALARQLLGHHGIGYGFLEREDELLAKLLGGVPTPGDGDGDGDGGGTPPAENVIPTGALAYDPDFGSGWRGSATDGNLEHFVWHYYDPENLAVVTQVAFQSYKGIGRLKILAADGRVIQDVQTPSSGGELQEINLTLGGADASTRYYFGVAASVTYAAAMEMHCFKLTFNAY